MRASFSIAIGNYHTLFKSADCLSQCGCSCAVPGNRLGVDSLDLYETYKAVVMALWEGREITYDVCPSRPYTRNAKNPDGHCPRLKRLENANRDEIIKEFFVEYPEQKSSQSAILAKVTHSILFLRSFAPSGADARVSSHGAACTVS